MYPPERAARFLGVIGFSFFVLVLHSVDKRQTYARLQLLDAPGLYRPQVSVSHTNQYDRPTSSQNFKKLENSLSEDTKNKVETCIQTYEQSYILGKKADIMNPQIRYKIHDYLNSESFVIEVGGYLGDEVREFFKLFEIGRYVVLEPVWEYYDTIRKRLKTFPQVLRIYNIGLGENDGIIKVRGRDYDNILYSESTQSESRNYTSILNIVSAEKFFKDIGIGEDYGFKRQLDLLILNCDGCEYDILDYLLTSPHIISHVRTIQFHSNRVKGREIEMIHKYCVYQQVLPLTHEVSFRHKFTWEAWTLRNKM